MAPGTTQRILTVALLSSVSAAAALLVVLLYFWLARRLGDATVPIPLILVLLVTAASFVRSDTR